MGKESKIEEKLVKAVKKAGGLCLKLVSPGYVGVPDRLILIAFGMAGFVEVKAPNEKPRKIQMKRHRELRELGFKTYVLDKEEDIPKIIEAIGGPIKRLNKYDWFLDGDREIKGRIEFTEDEDKEGGTIDAI